MHGRDLHESNLDLPVLLRSVLLLALQTPRIDHHCLSILVLTQSAKLALRSREHLQALRAGPAEVDQRNRSLLDGEPRGHTAHMRPDPSQSIAPGRQLKTCRGPCSAPQQLELLPELEHKHVEPHKSNQQQVLVLKGAKDGEQAGRLGGFRRIRSASPGQSQRGASVGGQAGHESEEALAP